MTTSTSTSLSHNAFTASPSDTPPAGGAFPEMSARATLIARALFAAVVLGWLSVVEPRLLVVLGFAVPFWIAAEIEARGKLFARFSPVTTGYTGLALVPAAAPTTERPSHRPAPKAA
jgi:hypothetical protein